MRIAGGLIQYKGAVNSTKDDRNINLQSEMLSMYNSVRNREQLDHRLKI